MVFSTTQHDRLIQKFIDHVSHDIAVQKAILYGSYAYGRPHEWSDIDLVIISPSFSQQDMVERLQYLYRAAWNSNTNWIQPIGHTPEEYASASPLSLLGEVKERGIVVYDSTIPKPKRARAKAKPAARRPVRRVHAHRPAH